MGIFKHEQQSEIFFAFKLKKITKTFFKSVDNNKYLLIILQHPLN